MSDLKRFVRQLADTLRTRDPSGVHRPVAVGDLRRKILPYRLYRNALGLLSNDDYDLLVLRLCAEQEDWVRTFPPEVAERCRAEIAVPYPDLDLLDAIEDATIQIGAAALARVHAGPDTPGDAAVEQDAAAPDAAAAPAEPGPLSSTVVERRPPASPVAAAGEPPAGMPPPDAAAPPAGSPAEAAPPPVVLPHVARSQVYPPAPATPAETARPDRCRYCAASLPIGRAVVYCPYCGHQLRAVRCTRCGTELEAGWRHCITCGHPSLGVANV